MCGPRVKASPTLSIRASSKRAKSEARSRFKLKFSPDKVDTMIIQVRLGDRSKWQSVGRAYVDKLM